MPPKNASTSDLHWRGLRYPVRTLQQEGIAETERRLNAVPGYTERATMPTPEATYCHACATTRQLLYPLPADPLTTAYQLRKYTKHTVVDPTSGLQGIFASTEAKVSADYLVDTRAASPWTPGTASTSSCVRVGRWATTTSTGS